MLPRDHDVNKIFTLENVLIETIKIDQIIQYVERLREKINKEKKII